MYQRAGPGRGRRASDSSIIMIIMTLIMMICHHDRHGDGPSPKVARGHGGGGRRGSHGPPTRRRVRPRRSESSASGPALSEQHQSLWLSHSAVAAAKWHGASLRFRVGPCPALRIRWTRTDGPQAQPECPGPAAAGRRGCCPRLGVCQGRRTRLKLKRPGPMCD
jgi:hypothetical protein